MARLTQFYISSDSVRKIILAKTEDAAKVLFSFHNPGKKINMCLRMVEVGEEEEAEVK